MNSKNKKILPIILLSAAALLASCGQDIEYIGSSSANASFSESSTTSESTASEASSSQSKETSSSESSSSESANSKTAESSSSSSSSNFSSSSSSASSSSSVSAISAPKIVFGEESSVSVNDEAAKVFGKTFHYTRSVSFSAAGADSIHYYIGTKANPVDSEFVSASGTSKTVSDQYDAAEKRYAIAFAMVDGSASAKTIASFSACDSGYVIPTEQKIVSMSRAWHYNAYDPENNGNYVYGYTVAFANPSENGTLHYYFGRSEHPAASDFIATSEPFISVSNSGISGLYMASYAMVNGHDSNVTVTEATVAAAADAKIIVTPTLSYTDSKKWISVPSDPESGGYYTHTFTIKIIDEGSGIFLAGATSSNDSTKPQYTQYLSGDTFSYSVNEYVEAGLATGAVLGYAFAYAKADGVSTDIIGINLCKLS